MTNRLLIISSAILCCIGCSTKQPFHEVEVDNPPFFPNTAFVSHEDLSSPKFVALKEKYKLDTIFKGETDELKRILLLRNWIRSVIKINDPGPHPGDGSVESILDNALKGNGYHCGHFMVVQNAIMNAYGYVTRCMGAGPGVQGGPDFFHGINEIWLNSHQKWFLSDAKYNHHFEKDGIPLSGLEIRDEFLKNKAADIKVSKGPNRTLLEFDEEHDFSKEYYAQIYTWLTWEKYNNKYVNWPRDSSYHITYEDEYTRNNTWIWDGKPHWALNTKYLEATPNRNIIEWTPNTISSEVEINGSKARITLNSQTPNLRTYQMKVSPDESWIDVANPTELELNQDKNLIFFRTVNAAGITGPEHTIKIEN